MYLAGMITRIRIDGFKTFNNFEIEFAPLTVIAGVNASGKSNLFDAMQLLSRIVETDLKTAFSAQRGAANELFSRYAGTEEANEMYFLVDLLVNKKIADNFGGSFDLKYTRLRYEIKLRREKNERRLDDLFIISESLNPIRHDDDEWVRRCMPKRLAEQWRPKVATGRRSAAYIETEHDRISLRQDGKGGIKREFPRTAINQAILSVVNSIDFPHAFAAKEEIRNWNFLQLNPDALRTPSLYLAPDKITQTGLNLAATLNRIKTTDPTALREISRRLNALLPGIMEVDVQDDEVGKQFIVQVKTGDGRTFSSRVLSEGTLRLLTLCVFLFDPVHQGTICYEEPENGIHPARIKLMTDLLLDLVSDFDDADSALRQVIVNTHSPVLVGEVSRRSGDTQKVGMWFSELVTRTTTLHGKKQAIQVTRMLRFVHADSMQLSLEGFTEQEQRLTQFKVRKYLESADFENEISALQG